MIDYDIELFKDVEEEILPLIDHHYKNHSPEFWFPLNLNTEALKDDTEHQHSFLVTAREDGILRGYALFQAGGTLLNKDNYIASVFSLYVDPVTRGQGVARGLIEFIEGIPAIEGVVLMMPNTEHADAVAKAFGYYKGEAIYIKRVEA